MIGITYGIEPYGDDTMGWTNPTRDRASSASASALLGAFVFIETKVANPMFRLPLFKIRAFTAGTLVELPVRPRPGRADVHAHHLAAGDLAAPARLLVLEHAAVGRHLHAAADRRASCSPGRSRGSCRTASARGPFATGGMLVRRRRASSCSSCCRSTSPTRPSPRLLFMNGLAMGAFAAPNRAGVMNSLPAERPRRRAAA